MKKNLSFKALAVMMLLFCGFFVAQSFSIKSDMSTTNVDIPIEVESEIIEVGSEPSDIPEIGFCRYQLGGVTAFGGAPFWFVNQVVICTPCTQGGPTNLPCPSPFGSSYNIFYNGNQIGTATNIVGLNKRCTPCKINERTGVTFN